MKEPVRLLKIHIQKKQAIVDRFERMLEVNPSKIKVAQSMIKIKSEIKEIEQAIDYLIKKG